MRMSIRARLALGLVPGLLGLVIVAGIATARIEASETDERWVAHTLGVLNEVGRLGKAVSDAENLGRAYRLTREPRYLDEYRRIRQSWRSNLNELRALIRDNPTQLSRVDQLALALEARTAALDALVELAQIDDDAVGPQVLQTRIQQANQETRLLIEAFEDTERGLLRERSAQAARTSQINRWAVVGTAVGSFLVAMITLLVIAGSISRPLRRLQEGALRVAAGDYQSPDLPVTADEMGEVARAFNQMKAEVASREWRLAVQDWVNSSLARFASLFQAPPDLQVLCQRTVSQLAHMLSLPYAVFYLRQESAEGPYLQRCASFAGEGAPDYVAAGEGLVGQCLREGVMLQVQPVPEGHVRVTTASGSSAPAQLLVVPALFEREVKAVLELGLLAPVTAAQREFLERFADSFGLVLNALQSRRALEDALERATRLSENLQRKQEELTAANDELRMQAEQLQASERLLREQQEQLRRANDEYEHANAELRETSRALQEQARQLASSSEYKSEFLASMSHELRTPLNSVLILSQLLAENPQGAMTDKQVEYARTIHEAGQDLLDLINDILDLSKIESGALRVDWETVQLDGLLGASDAHFRALAERKGLALHTVREQGAAAQIVSDSQRVWQIVKNLLANAVKFTEQGEVELRVRAERGRSGDEGVALEVRDSGIGIAPELQEQIFESFRQGDRGTARKYGGTGLGLAISRRLARLLGGELTVRSTPGQGSTFTLWLPLRPPGAVVAPAVQVPVAPAAGDEPPGASRTVVVVHGDPAVVERVRLVAAERGFDTVAARLDEVVDLCRRLWPSLIVLAPALDEGRGWVTLGLLKQLRSTRHVPVVLTCEDSDRDRAVRLGAATTVAPAELDTEDLRVRLHPRLELLVRPQRTVLVVEDDDAQRQALLDLLEEPDLHAQGVRTAADALSALESALWDCVVLDLGLPDMDGTELIRQMQHRFGVQCPPVVVYTGRDLDAATVARLEQLSDAIVVKGASSPERLLAETALLLHRSEARLSERARAMIERGYQEDPVLSGKQVLVVDDDVRNIFSVAAALETYGVEVLHAESGQAALDLLDRERRIDAVLMDIMMPGLDGLETTRRLRADPRWRDLPVVALTAKAMPGDRESCLQAGATEYLTKPLDMDRLRALLKVLLVRRVDHGNPGGADG
ncbi:MAG TPA: response regulator [Burkholderiaceae bacterium]|nr:response regulator [Burkholderiaceae bacterium]